MKPNILAIESSGNSCGVALLRPDASGAPTISVLHHDGMREHAEHLLPMATRLLGEAGLRPADLDAVAFGQGPGGFTGLRVACGVAQGMAMSLDIPVLPIVSHRAVAEAAARVCEALPGRVDVVVALDARMNETYMAAYRREAPGAGWLCLQMPELVAVHDLAEWIAVRRTGWGNGSDCMPSLWLAGDAWDMPDAVRPVDVADRVEQALHPEVASVARLAWLDWQAGVRVAPEDAAPLYVRDKVAFTTHERAQGQGGNPRAIAVTGG